MQRSDFELMAPAGSREALAAVRKAIELNPTEDRLRENEKYILAALK